MKKGLAVILGILAISLICPADETPCGIGKEADRLIALAKGELGVYSAVVIPHITKIRDSGGIDIALADATFDKLTAQAKKDGYDLRIVVSQLKAFNRLVVDCKEYPGYLKKVQADRERAAKLSEEKRQASLALQKQKEEEERLARMEADRLEKERAAQRRIDQENERKRQQAEYAARQAAEFQTKVDEMASNLSPGMVIKVPENVAYDSLIAAGDRGRVGVFSKLVTSGEKYIVTLKGLRDLRIQGKDEALWIKVALKKRKTYVITFIKTDFVAIEVMARSEKAYFRGR